MTIYSKVVFKKKIAKMKATVTTIMHVKRY